MCLFYRPSDSRPGLELGFGLGTSGLGFTVFLSGRGLGLRLRLRLVPLQRTWNRRPRTWT